MIDKKNLVSQVVKLNINVENKILIILCGFGFRKAIIIEDSNIYADKDFIMQVLNILGFIGLYVKHQLLLSTTNSNIISLNEALKLNSIKNIGKALSYPIDAIDTFHKDKYKLFIKFLKIKYLTVDNIPDEILLMNYVPYISNNISKICITQSKNELDFLKQICPIILNQTLVSKRIKFSKEFSLI